MVMKVCANKRRVSFAFINDFENVIQDLNEKKKLIKNKDKVIKIKSNW